MLLDYAQYNKGYSFTTEDLLYYLKYFKALGIRIDGHDKKLFEIAHHLVERDDYNITQYLTSQCYSLFEIVEDHYGFLLK